MRLKLPLLVIFLFGASQVLAEGEAPVSNSEQVSTEQQASGAAAAAPAQLNAPKQPLASGDGDWPDVSIDITELKRSSGNTLTLKFVLNNNSDKDVEFGYSYGEGGAVDYNTIGGVHLLDPVNKKKYFAVRDSNGKCVCSNGLKEVKPGEKMNLWAKFPAPPEGVKQIGIEIPHFMPLDDVPIG